MDEYLFMTLAKLKADRLKLEREQRATAPHDPEQLRFGMGRAGRHASAFGPLVFATALMEGAIMRTALTRNALTFAAAVVINVTALGRLGMERHRADHAVQVTSPSPRSRSRPKPRHWRRRRSTVRSCGLPAVCNDQNYFERRAGHGLRINHADLHR